MYKLKPLSERYPIELNVKYSRLTVIKDLGSVKNKRYIRAICDCGNIYEGHLIYLKDGKTVGCGCYSKEMAAKRGTERLSKHGLYKHPLYIVWDAMVQRCCNEKSGNYKNYGGRGVRICDEWRNNFKVFYDWAINNGWAKGLQLDKDINGDGLLYSPNTCLFVTGEVNSRHKRKTVNITIDGVTMCQSEWAKKLGVDIGTISNRRKANLDIETSQRNKRFIIINGKTKRISDVAKELNIKYNIIYTRIKLGWTSEEAIYGRINKRHTKINKLNNENRNNTC